MKDHLKSNSVFLIALGLIALGAVGVLLYATPEGLGLSDDSIAYIAGARSMLNGEGYREAWLASNGPVTHFPPGFSSILALIGVSGLDPVRGARFLNALLFGASSFLLGIIGWRMTKSQAAGMALAVLFAVNLSLFRAFAVAMSEPLYIFFSLAAFLTFSEYFSSEKNLWLIGTGLLVAFAYLTRYAGLALLATFLVALVLLHDTWKKRIAGAVIFIASFIPLVLAWSIRNKLVADNATNRTLVYHPLTMENLEIGIFNLTEFLVPVAAWRGGINKEPGVFILFVSAVTLAILIWVTFGGLKKFLQPNSARPEILSFTNGLYIFGYLASIISSMMLFDASTKFRLRILSPVYVSLLILFVLLGSWLWTKRAMLWRALVVLSVLFVIMFSVSDLSAAVTKLRKSGQGYASFQWYDSKAMDFLSGLPEDIRIYTNQPGPVYLYTDRPAYVLPDLVDPVTGLPRDGYEQGVEQLQAEVLAGEAALALFKSDAEDEDVQSVYMQLSDGLYLAHESRGDKIYIAFP